MSFKVAPVLLAAIWSMAGCAVSTAQRSEVKSAPVAGSTLEQRQRHTAAAYRELQQARYDKKLAEQDLLNAQSAYDSAQKNADLLKREADAARKAYAATQAREKAAEAAYEGGIRSVDELHQSGAGGSRPAR